MSGRYRDVPSRGGDSRYAVRGGERRDLRRREMEQGRRVERPVTEQTNLCNKNRKTINLKYENDRKVDSASNQVFVNFRDSEMSESQWVMDCGMCATFEMCEIVVLQDQVETRGTISSLL